MAHSGATVAAAALSMLALVVVGWAKPNYIVDNENIESFEGEEKTLMDFSKLKCIRRDRAFNGTMVFHEDMDNDNFSMLFELFSSSSGNSDYKKLGMDAPQVGICEGFKKFYRQLIQPSLKKDENSNVPEVPEGGLCPIPKGEYYIKEIHFNIDNWPSQAPLGSLKAVVTFLKGGKTVGGVILYLKISEK